MRIADRVAHWTTAVVVGTAALVTAAISLVTDHDGAGLWAAAFAAALVALGLAHVGARRVHAPWLRTLRGMRQELVKLAREGQVDARLSAVTSPEDVRELAVAANDVFDALAKELHTGAVAEARARSVVDGSPNGVLVVDGAGAIVSVNPAFQRLIELRPDPLGRRPIEVVRVPEVQEVVDRALAGDTTEPVQVVSGPRDLQLHGVPLVHGVLLLVTDVTKFRMAERARTAFVANVSHELRTPVAAILGYCDTLLDGPLDDDSRRMVTAVQRNGRRLRDLFDDLLELSRIEARRHQLPLAPILLAPVLAEAVAPAVDRAAERGIELDVDCPERIRVRGNAESLQAILRNLALNAVAYTLPGGHVRVAARPGADEVLVDVIDDGIGIDARHHERIFERFYRVDEGRARAVGGTGLGLAIVKHLAIASGCRVTLTSALGKGSTFTVHVPPA